MNKVIQFSKPKNHRLAVTHSEFYHELIRAYLHDGYDRASDIINQLVTEKLTNKSEAELLSAMALDFVATYRMLETKFPELVNALK